MRVGMGYDVHKLVEGRDLILFTRMILLYMTVHVNSFELRGKFQLSRGKKLFHKNQLLSKLNWILKT